MKDFLKNLKSNETGISMLLGVIVVIGVFGVLYKYFSSINRPTRERISATSTEVTPTPTENGETPAEGQQAVSGGDYVVEPGDSLWAVSMKAYGGGYNWLDIYQTNRQLIGTNANKLEVGTKLVLPKVEARATAAPVEYEVVRGDNLWTIASQYCGSGYAWPALARINQIAQPSLINVGWKLKIGCR